MFTLVSPLGKPPMTEGPPPLHLCGSAHHFAAELGAMATYSSALSAESMVRRMAFARFGATLANIGAYPVQHVRRR